MGYQPPSHYIEELTISGAGTTTGGSIPLDSDGLAGFSFHNNWNSGGGTLAATVLFDVSNDPRAFPGHDDYADADWVNYTATIAPTDVTTGAANAMENVGNARFGFVRMKVTYVSGSGLFECWFSAHGDG